MRIAFDLDGVLADMESELVRQAGLLFGESVTESLAQRAAEQPVDVPPARSGPNVPATLNQTVGHNPADNVPAVQRLRMTHRQQDRLWRHVASIENFWESLDEHELGAIARLAAIAAEHRWEVMFLTKRPETAGSTAQVQTQRWLQSKGFPLPSVYVVQGSRGLIGAALGLDVVVDDRPENCIDIAVDSKARTMLVWRRDAALVPDAIRRLPVEVFASVSDCLDALMEADAAGRARTGVMSRVKRLLR